MVDVGAKATTARIAVAEAIIDLPEEVFKHFKDDELGTKKGPVLQTAILAGIMASKRTSDLIPLCHPLPLDKCGIETEVKEPGTIHITVTAKTQGKTGVEMEALTAASVAALTVYDMCKAFSHDIVIKQIRLLHKSGGKRDFTRE